jgi:hypothetical protein
MEEDKNIKNEFNICKNDPNKNYIISNIKNTNKNKCHNSTLDKNLTYIFTSTTYNIDNIKYLYNFGNYDIINNIYCCMKTINIKNIPILYIEDISAYKYQQEIILPYGINLIYKYTKDEKQKFITEKVDDKKKDKYIELLEDKKDVFYIKKGTNEMSFNTSNIKNKLYDTNNIFIPHKYINDMNIHFKKSTLNNTHHNALHSCKVIILSLILFNLLLPDKYITDDYIIELIYTGLYHDIARRGVDGNDIFEKESAYQIFDNDILSYNQKITIHKNLMCFVNNGDKLINYSLISLIYKSADSIDYPKNYKHVKNILYDYDILDDNILLSFSDNKIIKKSEINIDNKCFNNLISDYNDILHTDNNVNKKYDCNENYSAYDIQIYKNNNIYSLRKEIIFISNFFDLLFNYKSEYKNYKNFYDSLIDNDIGIYDEMQYLNLNEVLRSRFKNDYHIYQNDIEYKITNISDLGITLLQLSEYFYNNNYIDINNIFDDYLFIFYTILPMCPLHYLYFNKYLFQFQSKNMFIN